MTREQFISHVERSQEALRRFLTALCCGDAQLADDIAQESYMKAYLSSDGFRSPEKFNAWIFKIAHNTFLSHKRSQRPVDDYEKAVAIASAEVSDASFRYQGLHAALANIPAKERTSILLHYMQGYAVKEISDITGDSPDAVRQQLSRGRSRLRKYLEAYGER